MFCCIYFHCQSPIKVKFGKYLIAFKNFICEWTNPVFHWLLAKEKKQEKNSDTARSPGSNLMYYLFVIYFRADTSQETRVKFGTFGTDFNVCLSNAWAIRKLVNAALNFTPDYVPLLGLVCALWRLISFQILKQNSRI